MGSFQRWDELPPGNVTACFLLLSRRTAFWKLPPILTTAAHNSRIMSQANSLLLARHYLNPAALPRALRSKDVHPSSNCRDAAAAGVACAVSNTVVCERCGRRRRNLRNSLSLPRFQKCPQKERTFGRPATVQFLTNRVATPLTHQDIV